MTITQLEYIIAVDTYRNFAEAARHCLVTQPTLSMQIKKLEQDLGVMLFDRSKKPVLTTEIGRLVIDQARITIKEADRIRELIQNEKELVNGELCIGIIPTLSPYLLPLFITDFMQEYPEIYIVIEELLSDQIIEKLNLDLIDVGILVTPVNHRNLQEVPLFYERFVVYTSEGHPLASHDLIEFESLNIREMWLLKEGHCFRSQVINICGEQLSKEDQQLHFESGSLETIRRLVDQQSGYTLLPELAANSLATPRRSRIRQFKEPQPIREVSLLTHRSYMKKRLIELLRDSIISHIPKSMLEQGGGQIIQWR